MSPQTLRSVLGLPDSTPNVRDSILVIIDAQNEYAFGKAKLVNIEPSRKVIQSLLEKYRAAGGDVIHVAAKTPAGAPIFTPETDLEKIFPELTPRDNEAIVTKWQSSAFTGTDFQATVDKIGKKKLVLVGYMAHNCISATARAGQELGYEIIVVQDAVGDRDIPGATAEELVRVSLAELADLVATLVNSTDFN